MPVTKHGMWKSKEWNSWDHAKRRCLNPNDPKYRDYGGRGITITERWLGKDGFINFFSDMGYAPSKNHSIDRINVNGNYCLENCRWATYKEQANNKRVRTSFLKKSYITFLGTKVCIDGVSKKTGVSNSGLRSRVDRGWSLEDIMEKPKYGKRKL